jgi:membrane protein DedA with SNARE-associated domain
VNSALTIVNAVAGLPPALLYVVIVVWLVIESAGVPLPNEAILLFGGFLVAGGHLHLLLAWAASVIGTTGGATVSWWIARTLGPPGVRRIGRYILLTPGRLAAAEGFFRRWGHATVFAARLTPVVRTLVSYPAGLAAMPYRPFILATAAGCAIWNLLMLLVGRAAGDHWTELFDRFHTPVLMVGVAIVLVGIAYLVLEREVRKRFAQPAGRV